MTALLTDNLPLLAGAPNGIKKLRELILELAVRGKLVPQDPSDEPASELLKRITDEKARLVAEGKFKKQKPLAAIGDNEEPFDLPTGWAWQRFGEIFSLEYGNNLPANKRSNTGEYPVYGSNGIVGTHNECFVSSPCIVVGRKGSAGALNLCLAQGCCVTDVAYYCIPPSACLLDYVFKLFHTLGLDSLGKGIKPGLNRNEAYDLVVAVPPFSEQHRIVAKVDELMILCDRLEAQQADAESAHAQLVQALLDSLTQTGDATDFAANWHRLAEHFHALFTTESSIDALKQTLLQLAVMGKLVPQDPSDESAEDLYERIQAERQRLVKKGALRKQKSLAEIETEATQLKLPSTWKWVPLLEITTGMDSGWSPSCLSNSSPSNDVWGVLKTTAVQVMRYLEHENKELPDHLEPRPEAEAKAGDILFTRAGPMNRVGISCLVESTRPKLMISDKIIRFHPVELGANGRFIALCLNAGATAKYLEEAKSGMAASQVNISQEKLRVAPIPLAPLAEQHRIVAKVDQLMHQCETLKQKIIATKEKQSELLNALIEQV